MSKELKIEKANLLGYEIVYSNSIRYGKDNTDTEVTVELNINGKPFKHTAYIWQWQVSEYLREFGADV